MDPLVRILSLPILSLSLLCLWPAATAATQDARSLVRTFLHDKMGFSQSDIEAVDAGRAVAKQMHTRDAVDVNIFGAVRIAAPAEAFIRQVRAIDVYERKLGVLQVGKFQQVPQLADLSALSLDRADLSDLASCRKGDCDIQLSAAAIEMFRTKVNWRAADSRPTANRLFQQMMFEWLETYRAGGKAALPAYEDQEKPISVAAEFKLLPSPGDMPTPLQELTRYVTDFPAATLADAEDFYYWNKGEFGMKSTIRLNHVTIYQVPHPPAPEPMRYIVATTQIYSDHYFSATLELRTVVNDAARPGQGFYLFYTTKSRVTGLTGFIGTLIRPLVRSRARSGMENYLNVTKKSVEGR